MRLQPRIYLVGSGEIGLSDSWDCHVYVVDGGSELAMIDAGGGRAESYAMIRRNLRDDGLNPARIRHIVLTHSHTDHARGAAGWRSELGARVYLPELERSCLEEAVPPNIPCPVDVGYGHEDVIQVGDLTLHAIHVPGHSPGSCALLLEMDGYRALFAGDIVFHNGVIGLINFAGSEMAPYRQYLPRLADLRVDALLPGHLLFSLHNGQAHIDLALQRLKQPFVPLSVGQLDVIYRTPDDYEQMGDAMLRAAVIGLGRMGSTYDDEVMAGGSVFLPYAHAPSYVAAPGVELVAGADPHDEQRTIFGERWGIATEHLYPDYREMLAVERPEIVSVCTTTRLRGQIVMDAARSGVKAIWAEKPIALSLRDADAMVAICREAGVTFAVNCARRWNPFFAQTRTLIEAGALGDLLQISAYGQCGLSHNGSHLIDAVRFLAGGEVAWVFGEMESDEAAAGELDLMGNGYLAFDNGVRAFVRGMPTGPAFWEFDVIGSTGRVRLINNNAGIEYTVMMPDARTGRMVPVQAPFPWPTTIEGTGVTIVRDLMHAIETGGKPRCAGEDGRAALEVALALRESHRQGGMKVTLPLANRELGIISSELRHDDVPARVRRSSH